MTASNPPPGWYDDPGRTGGVRYWDGRAWTPYLQPRQPAAPPPRPARAGRRPLALVVVAAVAAFAMVVALVGWQLVAATRPVAPSPPMPPATPVEVPPAPAGTIRPMPLPSPAQSMDSGCVDQQRGRLRTRATTVTLPPTWEDDQARLSLDCPATSIARTGTGFAGVSVASVNPDWHLSDDGVVAWVWDDLGIDASAREERSRGTVGGQPALLVTRRVVEVFDGVPHDTVVRVAVIDLGGGRRDALVTDLSVRQGATDPTLTGAVDALWGGVRVVR